MIVVLNEIVEFEMVESRKDASVKLKVDFLVHTLTDLKQLIKMNALEKINKPKKNLTTFKNPQ